MSISTEIARLQQAKADLKTAIEAKGVTVPAATTIDGYAALVDQIQQGGTLPYDAEIEYLQSSGTQYIDTGVKPSTDIRLTVDVKILSTGGMYQFGSVSTVGTVKRFHIGFNGNVFQIGVGTAYTNIDTSDTNRHLLQIDGKRGVGLVDSKSAQGNTTAYPDLNIFLFARNLDGSANAAHSSRLYSAQIYKYSTEKMLVDFIPVRVGQVGCLYDRVSGSLFYNQGTGSFTLGPDVT